MLSELTPTDWTILIAIVAFGGFLVAHFMDHVMGQLSAGLIGGGLVLIAGAFGGLYALDYAFRHRYVSMRWSSPEIWAVSAVGAAMTLLLVITALRVALKR